MTPLAFVAKHAMDAAVGTLTKTASDKGIDWAKLWDDHKAKIIGGGVGALGGALGGMAMNPDEQEDPEANRWLRPMLGGLAGAGAGVGAGYGYEALGGWDGIKKHLGFGDDAPAAEKPPAAKRTYAQPGMAAGAPLGALGGLAAWQLRGMSPERSARRAQRGTGANLARAIALMLGGAGAGTAAGGVGGSFIDRQ